MSAHEKQFSPAAERNKQPIRDALARILPAPRPARVLELASGSGQHAAWCVAGLPNLTWQPTERDPVLMQSLAAFQAEALDRFLAPVAFDLAQDDWGQFGTVDAVFAANLAHVAPWEVVDALFIGAATVLAEGGQLILYGPFLRDGQPVSPADAAFDESLRAQNPAWGLRDVADLHDAAAEAGLAPLDDIPMPANNAILVWARGL